LLLDHLSLRVKEDQRGEALHLILLLQAVILLLHLGALAFALREVDLDEDEILVGIILEGRLIERFFLQANAPSAPVAASEIKKDILVFLGGSGEGGVIIITPTICCCGKGGQDGGNSNEEEGACGIHISPVIPLVASGQ